MEAIFLHCRIAVPCTLYHLPTRYGVTTSHLYNSTQAWWEPFPDICAQYNHHLLKSRCLKNFWCLVFSIACLRDVIRNEKLVAQSISFVISLLVYQYRKSYGPPRVASYAHWSACHLLTSDSESLGQSYRLRARPLATYSALHIKEEF